MKKEKKLPKNFGKVVTTLPTLLKRKKRQGGKGKPFEKSNPWRFPKGTSGNPGGRPRKLGESIAAALAVEIDGHTVAQLIAEKLCESAIAGDAAATREIRLATEGETIHTPDQIQVVIDR